MRSAQVRSLGKPSSGGAADPKFCSQEPNRETLRGEIGEASCWALQKRAPVSQHLIQPIEMRAQLIEQVGHRRHHCDGIDLSARRT